MKTNDAWIVIPAYNEAGHIRKLIERVRRYTKKIVVVDDGSRDNTFKAANESGAIVLKHIINMGKGAALKTGCDYVLSQGAKKIIVMDADGQHKAEDIPRFVDKLDSFSMVFGCRRFNKNMPAIFRFGNKFINNVSKILFGINIKDTQSGYRAFLASTYRKIRWQANDYSMESEMIANIGRNHIKYTEIEIDTIYSDRYKGTTVIDGVKIVLKMIWWKITG